MRKVVKLAVVASLAATVVAALALPVDAAHGPMVTRFLGRFHVLALHVPVGALVVALAAEGATLTRRLRRTGAVVVGFALPILVVTGAAAIVLGLMLASGGHYPHKLVAPHRNFTILSILLASAATLRDTRRARGLHRALLGASALAMTIGAHFGGSMTHGKDYLTAPVDEPKPKDEPPQPKEEPQAVAPETGDAGAEAAAPAIVDAGTEAAAPIADAGAEAAAPKPKPSPKAVAQAILNRRCAPCHTTRSKGGLRVTDISHPSNKNGVLVPGAPESSSIYTRLLLPLDDDDHMPPKDETQPTKGEIAAIRAYIASLKDETQ